MEAVFRAQIEANKDVQRGLFGYWLLAPTAAPSGPADLTTVRSTLDSLDRDIVAEISARRQVLAGPECLPDLVTAAVDVVTTERIDALHQVALVRALGRCAAPSPRLKRLRTKDLDYVLNHPRRPNRSHRHHAGRRPEPDHETLLMLARGRRKDTNERACITSSRATFQTPVVAVTKLPRPRPPQPLDCWSFSEKSLGLPSQELAPHAAHQLRLSS